MPARRAGWRLTPFLLAFLAFPLACSKTDASSPPPSATALVPPPAASAGVAAFAVPAPSAPLASPRDAASGAGTTAPFAKRHTRVLHTGDSMVGGGLARALRPKLEADGAKYFRDVWESGSLRDFSRSDRIAKRIKDDKPDLILLSLGANDVYETKPEVMAPFVAKIAKMTEGIDCVWIGPPIWKREYDRIVPVLRDNAAPCVFFDASGIEMHRKPDGIHPDEKGGETYADALWAFLRPPDAGNPAASPTKD